MALEGWVSTEQVETEESCWDGEVIRKHSKQRKERGQIQRGKTAQKRHGKQQVQLMCLE